MKVFVCRSHSGHYIAGCSVVVAETERKAKNALIKELKSQGIEVEADDDELELEELDITKAQVDVLFDGNY